MCYVGVWLHINCWLNVTKLKMKIYHLENYFHVSFSLTELNINLAYRQPKKEHCKISLSFPFKESQLHNEKQNWVQHKLLRCNFLFLRIISIQNWWLLRTITHFPSSFSRFINQLPVENILKVCSNVFITHTVI